MRCYAMGEMKPLKAKVSITLDEDIIGELKQLAEKEDRSLSQFINRILKGYLKGEKKIKSKEI